MRKMYDSVNPARIPRDAQIVAGYVNGPYKWSDTDWALFPNAIHVGIAVRASFDGGEVLDVEPGDATPAQAPNWVLMRRARGVDPTIYCNESTWPTVVRAFDAAGVVPPHYWIAHYDGDERIPIGAVAKQYRNTADWDISSVADYWPGIDKKGPARDMQQADIVRYWDPNIPSGTNNAPSFNQYLSGVKGLLDDLTRNMAALQATVAGIANDPDVSPEALRQMINDAVSQHISITGDVHIGPAE